MKMVRCILIQCTLDSHQDVIDNVGFELNVSRVKGETLPPTKEQVELLYNKIDPEGIFLP